MRKWTIFVCLLVGISVNGQNGKDLYFQPGFASGASASKVFEEINYIPLQTTKKSVFGRIRKLLVSDNYYIIWDGDTNFIYFFDKKGGFVHKYRPRRCNIKSVQLDKKRNAIFISGSDKNYNFSQTEIEKMMEDPTNESFSRFTWSGYYDLEDVRKEKVKELNNFSLALVSPVIFNHNWWAYSYISADRRWKDMTGYELNVYDGQKNIAEYFPYNKKNDAYNYRATQLSFFPTDNSEQLLFTRPFHNSIYLLTKDSFSLLYNFILPMEISLSKTFFTQSFRNRNDVDQYRSVNGGQVWGIENVYKLQHYLLFSLDYNKSWRERFFLYDESSGKFYNTGKINTDSANAYLPVLPGGVQYCDGEYLYTSLSSNYMFQSRDNNASREPQYPPALKQYFEKGTRTDNPVIIQLKLKNKIG